MSAADECVCGRRSAGHVGCSPHCVSTALHTVSFLNDADRQGTSNSGGAAQTSSQPPALSTMSPGSLTRANRPRSSCSQITYLKPFTRQLWSRQTT